MRFVHRQIPEQPGGTPSPMTIGRPLLAQRLRTLSVPALKMKRFCALLVIQGRPPQRFLRPGRSHPGRTGQ